MVDQRRPEYAGGMRPARRRVTAVTGRAAVLGCAALTCCALVGGCGAPARSAKPPADRSSASSLRVYTEKLPTRALPSPGCRTATAVAPTLSGVRTAMVSLSGDPFGVAVTPDGKWAFVALGGGVEVLRITGSSLAPRPVRTIPVAAGPAGVAMTADGRYLLAAVGSGAVVIDVARATTSGKGAVLGTLSDPRLSPNDGSAIEVALSPGDGYAFVTDEYNDLAAVYNLHKALTSGFGPADYVGSVPLGQAAVGMAVSPDGRWLYATSEAAANSAGQTGTLTVINLRRAETDPAGSAVATVHAGCNPVRVIVSGNGDAVWVDARASDDLLCFSAARLLTDPSRALVAIVPVGELPVGLALVRGGSLIVIADSDRFDVAGKVANLGGVNVGAAPAGN